MTGEDIRYPFTPATDRWTIRTAGLNHFTWLVDIRDNDGSEGLDRMEDLRAALDQGATSGSPYAESLYRQTGFLLIPSDEHTRDFLLPSAGGESLAEPSHGTSHDREARRQRLAAVAEGREPFTSLLEHPSWERPGDLIRALRDGSHVRFHGLNLPNQGQLPGVQEGVFVETPAFAEHYTIQAETIQLPPTVLALCQRTALVTDTIVRGALHHSRTIVHQAVELDPTVLDKRAGFAAIDACMEAHADLIGAYT
jgi:alpha-galactosidase/6-phospho-beta-glucosidase family protein